MEEQGQYKVVDKRMVSDNEPRSVAVRDDSFLSVIERLSSRPDIDVEKIRQIMDMQERVLDRNAKQAFNAAMKRAQNRIDLVVARAWNDQTKSNYAALKTILLHAKPIYTDEGFSLMFYEGDTAKENHKRICVDIMHEDGHTEKRWGDFAVQTTGIAGKAMMTQIHGEGSAFLYGRRYLTCAIFNIPTGDDDDGNAAGDAISEFITEEQAQEIKNLLKEKKFDDARIKKFLEFAGAETVDTIPSKKYKEAVINLKAAKPKPKERTPGEEG